MLVVRAKDGVRTTDSLSSQASISRAAAHNAFYDCLSNQAQKLVPAGASVSVATGTDTSTGASNGTSTGASSANLGLELLSAVVRWAHIAPDASQAKIVLEVQPGSGPEACSGLVVLATLGGAR